ncbi:3770_t:CDS:1, partial [Rhizophagus irregularis]
MTFVFELKLMVNKASEDSKERQIFQMSRSHDTAIALISPTYKKEHNQD